MKIAQIAPLIESVPPRFYGGTERVVSYLSEELVRLGHDVTLFASGDSVTAARLISCATTALRLNPNVRDHIPYYMLMLDRVRECADDFDILHFHIDVFQFPLSLPKIRSIWIRNAPQNHRIIKFDACEPALTHDVRRRHIQVATQARSREPVSPSSAQYRIEASTASSAVVRQ